MPCVCNILIGETFLSFLWLIPYMECPCSKHCSLALSLLEPGLKLLHLLDIQGLSQISEWKEYVISFENGIESKIFNPFQFNMTYYKVVTHQKIKVQ